MGFLWLISDSLRLVLIFKNVVLRILIYVLGYDGTIYH